ncbi:MAG: flippase-like domain-containing protein [Ruminococcus sp.]|nr:flippase-like domain-containing protein [Ruminococcus sp.]
MINEIKRQLTLKRLVNIIVFILIAVLTFYIVFSNNDLDEIIINIKRTDKKYIFIAIMCMFIYLFTEGLNKYRLLKAFKEKVSLIQTFKYSIISFFFSSITPSSTGGQPMQLYFMSKDKLQMSHCTLALLIELLSFQFITLILALLGLIFHYNDLLNSIGNIKYLLIFGFSVNIIVQAFLIVMIFSKRVGQRLITFFYKTLKRLHYKKADYIYDKAFIQLKEYHDCARYLSKNKMLLLKTILTTTVQMSVYHSIPFFIYRSFGLSQYNVITFIIIEAVLYISVASLPLPGAMGASEGVFMVMFKIFFPISILSSAMIISRGISFYLFVVISLVLIMIFIIVDKYKRGRLI